MASDMLSQLSEIEYGYLHKGMMSVLVSTFHAGDLKPSHIWL